MYLNTEDAWIAVGSAITTATSPGDREHDVSGQWSVEFAVVVADVTQWSAYVSLKRKGSATRERLYLGELGPFTESVTGIRIDLFGGAYDGAELVLSELTGGAGKSAQVYAVRR